MKRFLGMTARDLGLVISFSIALLLLIVAAVLVEKARSSQDRYNRLGSSSADVLRSVELATTNLALAESAVRGYVLTADTSFESIFAAELSDAREHLRSIQRYELVPEEAILLARTTGAMEERAELLRRAIFLRTIAMSEAQELLQSGEPTRVMNLFLSEADSLTTLLGTRLAGQVQQEDQQLLMLLFLSRAGSIIAIAIIILALVSTIRYLKERTYAESLLRLSEEKFRLAVENSPVVQFVANPMGTITMIEGTGLQVFGADPDALTGRHLSDLLGKIPVVDVAFTQAMHGESVVEEFTLGSSVVEVLLAPYRSESGTIVGVTGVWRDISERKNAEKALEAIRQELQRSNYDLEQFAYVASHDLQAPLRASQEYIRMLESQDGPRISDAGKGYLDHMKVGLDRMISLIQDLLEYSRVGSSPPSFAWVDLSAIVHDAVREFEGALTERNGSIEIGDLPVIEGNEGQLRQVFRNLIGNGLKFVHGRPPVMSIHARAEDAGWTVFVSDNGIGINERDQDRIFKIFQRVQTPFDVEGNGFGLAITKRIIEKHGGSIRVSSKPGKGSTFILSLPKRSA